MRTTDLLFVLITIFITSCGNRLPEQQGMPDIGIPVQDLNTQIRVYAHKGLNTFKENGCFALIIDVIGEETIIFPPDFGEKVFAYENGQWLQIGDFPVEYRGGSSIIPPSKGDPLAMETTIVCPRLPDYLLSHRRVLLRVFIFGHIYRDGKPTDEKVGGYADVILRP